MTRTTLLHGLIFCVLFAVSCRKDKGPLFDGSSCDRNCFILTGKLVDSAANAGIPDAEIKFYHWERGSYPNGNLTRYLGRTQTDAAGNYFFQFEGTAFNDGYFYGEVFHGEYFSDLNLYERNKLPAFRLNSTNYNIPYVVNYPLFLPGTVKVRVVLPPQPAPEFVGVSYNYGKVPFPLGPAGWVTQLDTTFSLPTAGNINTYIEVYRKKPGFQDIRYDTVLVPIHGVRTVQVLF